MQVWKTLSTIGGQVFAELFGGLQLNGPLLGGGVVAVAYSAAMTPDLAEGSSQLIAPTDGVAFAINAPTFGGAAMSATNPPGADQQWTLTMRNASGGALGVATFNAVFKLGAAWTQPADGFSRSIQFQWNGTNHIEVGRTAADVAN